MPQEDEYRDAPVLDEGDFARIGFVQVCWVVAVGIVVLVMSGVDAMLK